MTPDAMHEALRLLHSDDPAQAGCGASLLDRKDPEHRKKILARLRGPSTPFPVAEAIVSSLWPFGTAFIEADHLLVLRLFSGWKRNKLRTDAVYRILERNAAHLPASELVALLPHDNAVSLLVAGGHEEAFPLVQGYLLDEIPPDTIAAPIDRVALIRHPGVAQLLAKAYRRWPWKIHEHQEFAKAFGTLLPAPEAAATLATMLRDDRLEVRTAAGEALTNAGVKTSTFLTKLLERGVGESPKE